MTTIPARIRIASLAPRDTFPRRHIGPDAAEVKEMLSALGLDSLEALVEATVPAAIRLRRPLRLPEPRGEHELIDDLRKVASRNEVYRSFIGMGYHDCITPPVIQRNVLENPGWYTQYTPYQAEIAQGRLEALLNFQTMVADLTGLPLANASLLDEGTAAAEAMVMCAALARSQRRRFMAAADCHPQTLAVVRTRARSLGIEVVVADPAGAEITEDTFGVLLQYPTTDGRVVDYAPLAERAHAAGAQVVVASDLMALTLLRPPGEFGADIAVGSTQRFGVPLGFGGPHAAYLSTRDDHKRQIPGRLVGVSRDRDGRPAFRLALQTREQHIRRDKATSNICTAQVLLAIMAGMYGVYHGPDGLRAIASRIHALTARLAAGLKRLGLAVGDAPFFDTLRVSLPKGEAARVVERAAKRRFNLRDFGDGSLGVSLDEVALASDVAALLEVFAGRAPGFAPEDVEAAAEFTAPFARTSGYLAHEVFNRHHSETEMLRYIHRLQARDLSLTTSMIPLGSCTMKLNATSEMLPVTWPEFGEMHPFAPADQTRGYAEIFEDLEAWLAEITGFAAVSLQPNAGSQGEYAGLLTIRAYHESRGEAGRKVCLIPVSAHGTNPASAVTAGFKVLVVACEANGNIDVADLRRKAEEHRDDLGALMVTYPSTYGVFEESIREVCDIVHAHGGQVYMDGANMNAQVGLTRPGDIGADVCHLNLHKTFCLAVGTQVALPDGTSRPIESLVPGGGVQAWSEGEGGVRAARLDAVFHTGRKRCVQVTLQDGRTITCTPDHRVLTTDGWIESGRLDVSCHRVVVGPESVLDDPAAGAEAERRFRADYAGLSLSMSDPPGRARTLAFFRLLGAACSDGTYAAETSGRRVVRLYFGTWQDARRAVDDIELLTGARPMISKCRTVFAVRLPAVLVAAIGGVPGIGEPGRRVRSIRTLPDLVDDPATPLAVLREFLGALFGGDGCAPLIVHLQRNPATLKPVRFSQSRVDPDVLQRLQRQLCGALVRLGVEATADRIALVRAQASGDTDERVRWTGGVTVIDGLAFAERIGFRYCAHKAARLSVAAAFWRMKRRVHAQRIEVAQRALARGPDGNKVRLGPKPVWSRAVAEAYDEFASQQPVLSRYYASFAGSARLSKQHLINAIDGVKGTRRGVLGQRRTHRRVLAAPTGRGGAKTALPGLLEFVSETGAASWFNAHTPRGGSYRVAYATSSQEAAVAPIFSLRVIDVRPAGDCDVYDLTVDELHSFLANGVVVHNCIPHGGGGPGMGPIGVAAHLAPFLPGHPVTGLGTPQSIGTVSAAPYGSPSILTIPWVYIALMGAEGLKRATEVAILNANYMAKRLEDHYPVVYRGGKGRVAHEFIVDIRPFKDSAGIEVDDIAKRLMDYGFHSPTMSFPVAGTLMIEPTESEPKGELDRFCDAMIAIREEIRAIEEGRMDRADNPLKNAPHTARVVTATEWAHPYTREVAAFPAAWVRAHKFWPAVGRIDNTYGDRNLVCACPPMESYE